MQNINSYHAVPQFDGWAHWQVESNRNFTFGSSSATLGEGSSSSSSCRIRMKTVKNCSAIPMSYTLTPPTPSTSDSDASSSQISMESIPEYDEYPEIPFVSAAISSPDRWMSSDRPAEDMHMDAAISSTPFWAGVIGLRSITSKSSTDTSASSTIFTPARTSRKRSGSVSSIASSRTRPAPAKSILSSGSSVKTRRHKAPSVKFLDAPTIHYDDHDDRYHDDEHEPSSCMSPPPPKKAKGLSGFFSFKWLFSSPSPASPCSSSSSAAPRKMPARLARPSRSGTPSVAAQTGRPTISGPFPLWNSTPRRGLGTRAGSLRSAKSSTSLRSVRSCGSRLPTPTYWPR